MCNWRGFSNPGTGFQGVTPHNPDFGLNWANVYRGLGGVFWEVRDLIWEVVLRDLKRRGIRAPGDFTHS